MTTDDAAARGAEPPETEVGALPPGDEGLGDPGDGGPDNPAAGIRAASRPAGWWAGPYGRPLHPLVAAVAIGAWVCASGFDLISLVADTAWVYARGAYVLTLTGVTAGVAATLVGLADLTRVPRDTPAFRTGIRHMLAMDVCLVLFAASFLVRRTSDFAWHDPVAPAAIALSVAGLGALLVGMWHGLRLSYTFGVRAVEEPDRRRGYTTR